MKAEIGNFLKKYLGLTIIVSALVGAVFSWAVTWILPSRDVTASNIPQKELTCTLDYFYPMITRKSSDNRLQLLYDEEPVSSPYVYGITVTNTGDYAVTNEDFKDTFSIDFSGSSQLVYAQVVKSTNGAITEEVLSNARIEGTVLSIADLYLNTDESFGIYLIVDGKPDNIIYHSRISGISKLILRNTPKEKRDDYLHRMVLFACGGILVIAMFSVYTYVQGKKTEKKYAKMLQAMQEDESGEE